MITPKPIPEPQLLSCKQVGALLGVSARQVWKLASKGIVPKPVKLGGSTRWRKSEIDSLIEKLAGQN